MAKETTYSTIRSLMTYNQQKGKRRKIWNEGELD